MERGKRVDYALRIAQRYGLSARRAIVVTDNRLTIARALGLTSAVPYQLAPAFGPDQPVGRDAIGAAVRSPRRPRTSVASSHTTPKLTPPIPTATSRGP